MMEREGRDEWTTVSEEMGAGGISGRSGRSAFSRERETSSSEIRTKEPVIVMYGGQAARMLWSEITTERMTE